MALWLNRVEDVAHASRPVNHYTLPIVAQMVSIIIVLGRCVQQCKLLDSLFLRS